MLGLITVLVLTGLAARLVIYEVAPDPYHPLAKIMKRLDLGHEPSLPNWYSSLALLGSALLLGVISHLQRIREAKFARHWLALTILFLLMALDEAIVIHEMADDNLHRWLDTGGMFYFAWVIPGSILAGTVSLFFLNFLRNLDKQTRNGLLLAGGIFLGGALGVEMIEGAIVDSAGLASIHLSFVQAVEEFMEMLGIAILIYTLLNYLHRHLDTLTLSVMDKSVLTVYGASSSNPTNYPIHKINVN